MSVEIVITPLDDTGRGLLDALEARTGKLPYQMNSDGSRHYHLPEEDAGTSAFDTVLDKLDQRWRDHLHRTG